MAVWQGEEDLVSVLYSMLADARGEAKALSRQVEAMELWCLWLADRVYYLETREWRPS